MSLTGLHTNTVRDAAHSLRVGLTTLDAILSDLDSGSAMAALISETASARNLVTEIGEEVDLLQRILDTKATAMELTDSAGPQAAAWLMSQLQGLVTDLEMSLRDDIGSTGSPEELREYYRDIALEKAGIDLDDWDPSKGVDHNREIVEAVYEYYARLHLENPELLWPGIGSLAGATFYGGFQDLDKLGDLLGGDEDGLGFDDIVEGIFGLPFDIPLPDLEGWDAVEGLSPSEIEEEIRWFESRFLTMQQKIFLDMSSSHEAYLDGGMLAIERLYQDDPFHHPQQAIDAWRLTDEGIRTGDVSKLQAGATELAYREQRYIIQSDYDKMYQRPTTGPAFTYAATLVGTPSVPEAKTFPELFPIDATLDIEVSTPQRATIPYPKLGNPFNGIDYGTVDAPLPHAGVDASVTINTPFPDGNIAHFDDRWEMFNGDTLPRYFEIAEEPGAMEELLGTPIGERAEAYSMPNNADDIAKWVLYDGWKPEGDLGFDVGFG